MMGSGRWQWFSGFLGPAKWFGNGIKLDNRKTTSDKDTEAKVAGWGAAEPERKVSEILL